jgi:hypothetical protein
VHELIYDAVNHWRLGDTYSIICFHRLIRENHSKINVRAINPQDYHQHQRESLRFSKRWLYMLHPNVETGQLPIFLPTPRGGHCISPTSRIK